MRRVLAVLLTIFPLAAYSAGRELGPRGGGPAAYNVSKPLTAYAGGRFLTVWEQPMGAIGTPVMGALSDASGRRISPVAFPIAGTTGTPLELTGIGDAFALFTTAYLIELDLDGRPTATHALPQPSFNNITAEWNGSRFLVATWRSTGAPPYESEVFLLDREGKVLHGPRALQNDLRAFAIVPSANGFTMIASGSAGTFAYRIANDGTIAAHEIERTAVVFASVSPVAAPAADGGVHAVWAKLENGRAEMRAADVTAAGEVRNLRTLFSSDDLQLRALHLLGATLVYSDSAGIHTPVSPNMAQPAFYWSTAASDGMVFVAYVPANVWPLRVLSVTAGANGAAGASDVVSFSRTRQTQPVLGTGGGRFLAAWTDVTGSAAFVRAASIGVDGGAPLTDHIIAPAYLAGRDLPWNGVEYLVVGQREKTLSASRVALDGTPIDAAPFPLATTQLFNVAATVVWSGHEWLVFWPESDQLRYVVVLRSGIVSEPRQVDLRSPIPNEWWRTVVSAAAAWNGTTLLVAWSEDQRPPCFFPPCDGGTRRTFVTRFGSNDAPFELSAATTLSIATSGSEFLVLGGATAHAIDASSGTRLIASNQLLDWPAMGDVTWDGLSYAVALRYSGMRRYLSVTHLSRSASFLRAVGTETLPPDEPAPPSIAALLPGAALIAVQEGDATDGARAVIYRESDFASLPPPPAPPRNLRVTAVGTNRYEVTWDPSPSAGVEHYRVEGLTAGDAWAWVGAVPATEPLRIVSPFAVVRVRAFHAGGVSQWLTLPARRRTTRP